MKLISKTAIAITLTVGLSASVFAETASVVSQYPFNLPLKIQLPTSMFHNITVSDVQIQNGYFYGSHIPRKLPSNLSVLTTAINNNYALSFTLNNLPLGACSITFYTPLVPSSHPGMTASCEGCLSLAISIPPEGDPAAGFQITPYY